MKHPEVRQKFFAARGIFNSLDILRLMMLCPPLKVPTHCKQPLIDPFLIFFFFKKMSKMSHRHQKKIIKANQNRTKQSSLQRFLYSKPRTNGANSTYLLLIPLL